MIIHGVFLNILNYGVLITGPSRIGKSVLALNLISRGHQLIADDAPEFSITPTLTVHGKCPPLLQDKLAVYPLGIINIRQLFGERAIYSSQTLHFVVNLANDEPNNDNEMSLLNGHFQTTSILGISVPQISMSATFAAHLPLLTETAVRHYFLNRDSQ